MSRKKRPEPDDKEQAARFIKVAKQIEEPISKKAFEEVFDKIVKKKRVSKIINKTLEKIKGNLS